MGFILDGLETESYDREYRDRDLLLRILSYFRPFRSRVVQKCRSQSRSVGLSGRKTPAEHQR